MSSPSSPTSITSNVVVDTHAIVWYLTAPHNLSVAATRAIDYVVVDVNLCIYVSAITLVEITYLIEKGRIDGSTMTKLLNEVDAPSPLIKIVPVDRLIADALNGIPRTAVPEMPDRIIAATALHLGLPVVTADSKIQSCGAVTAIW